MAEVCITTRVLTPLWHVLIQASDNIVAVTVTTVVAVPQSEWLCHSDRQVSPVTMNWPIFFSGRKAVTAKRVLVAHTCVSLHSHACQHVSVCDRPPPHPVLS